MGPDLMSHIFGRRKGYLPTKTKEKNSLHVFHFKTNFALPARVTIANIND